MIISNGVYQVNKLLITFLICIILHSTHLHRYSKYKEINKNYASGQQVDVNEKNEYYASLGVKYTPLQGLSFAFTSDFSYSTLYNNFEDSKAPRRLSSISVLAAQYNVGR